MATSRLSTGTTAVIAIPANPRRIAWSITMPPTGIESGNTGICRVSKGSPPGAADTPQQGRRINAGSTISERENYPGDKSVFKGDIWVIASATTVLELEEDSL